MANQMATQGDTEMGEPTNWARDEQQISYVRRVYDLTVHDEPIIIGLADIDMNASQSIGQNRLEMALDQETVDIIALYAEDGVTMPMPLVWKKDLRSKKVVALDGRHRIEMALVVRGEDTLPAILVTGESQVAQMLAGAVNTQHGRSVRNIEYLASYMRQLRDQGQPVAHIARMFGIPDSRVYDLTRRDEQAERVRRLIPERSGIVRSTTLDLLGQLEDNHVRILGQVFLDATKQQQRDIVERIKNAPSNQRDQIAHELHGELRLLDEQRRKVKAKATRPASQLQGALQRLRGVADPTRAFYQSTDQQKAIMRANLAEVLPRLQRLWANINEPVSGVA